MTPTDEQLSAFLDHELPAAEMASIRQAIAEDPAVSDRLAWLASADHQLQSTYSRIDEAPMAEGLSTLVQALEAAAKKKPTATAAQGTQPTTSNNVVALQPKKPNAPWQWLGTATAAGVMGFALATWSGASWLGGNIDKGTASWAAITAELDAASTGEHYSLGEQATLEVRLSFTNNQGHYCRQFDVQHPTARGQYIACKSEGAWQLHSKLPLTPMPAGEYQTASNNSLLDTLLDSTMQGAPLNKAQEQAAKAQGWQATQ